MPSALISTVTTPLGGSMTARLQKGLAESALLTRLAVFQIGWLPQAQFFSCGPIIVHRNNEYGPFCIHHGGLFQAYESLIVTHNI